MPGGGAEGFPPTPMPPPIPEEEDAEEGKEFDWEDNDPFGPP